MRNAKMKICALLNIMQFWHVNPEPIKNDVLEAFRDGRPNQQEITRLHYSHYIINKPHSHFKKIIKSTDKCVQFFCYSFVQCVQYLIDIQTVSALLMRAILRIIR